MLKAITRSARHIDSRLAGLNSTRSAEGKTALTVASFFDYYAREADLEVAVEEEDFVKAKGELVPSVSVEELGHYERVRDAFEGGRGKEGGVVGREGGVEGARPKLSEVMKRAAANGSAAHSSAAGYGSRDAVPTLNGTGAGAASRRHANVGREGSRAGQDSDADEDDYVIRTDKLSLNAVSRPVSSRSGKGKGKGRETPGLDVDGVAEGEGEGEDLYD